MIETDESDDSDSDFDDDLEKEVDEIMDDVFGGYDWEACPDTLSDFETDTSDTNMEVNLDS